MKFVLFALDNNDTVAINPERVDAFRTMNGHTRIFIGDSYFDVIPNLPTVYEALQKACNKQRQASRDE